MKKLYLFFAAILACSAIASAADWDIVVNVTGADRVEAYLGSSVQWYESFDPATGTKVEFNEGNNDITIPENKTLFVRPLYSGDIFSFKSSAGDGVASDQFDWYQIEWASWKSPMSPYTITAVSEESYRDKSVTVTMDDCSKVTIVRLGDQKPFNPTENTIEIKYNSEKESEFQIKPRGYYNLYEVTADGNKIEKGSSYYKVNLVDNSGDEPVYVQNINVKANFPPEQKFKTTISLIDETPAEIISSITINGNEVEDLSACLSADGFEAEPNSKILISFNNAYILQSYSDNGEPSYVSSATTNRSIDYIDRDHEITIKGQLRPTYDVKFNITGADGVILKQDDKPINIEEGVNTFSVTDNSNAFTVEVADGWDLTVMEDATGKNYFDDRMASWYWENYHYFSIEAEEGSEFTIVAVKPETKTVTVTMDDCSLVKLNVNGKDIEPAENTVELSYKVAPDAQLIVKPRSYSGSIYQVIADDKPIEKGSSWFYVNLVDNTGDEPVYVQNVRVDANYPDDLTFKTVITLEESSEEMISYIKINDVAVDDIKTYLSPEGFEAKPLSTIAIGFSSDYKVDEVVDNGVKKYPYSQYTIEDIDRNHDISIKGHKYAIYNVKFNITGADGIVASLGSSTIPFVEGTQEIKFSEKNNYVTFSQADGWEIETFLWGEDYDMLDSGDWRYYGKVYINAEEGDEYTIVANKIKREDQISVYFDDYDAKGITFSYFKCEFENYEAPTANIKPGYNSINFRKQDGYFKVVADKSYFCEVPYTELVVYKNSEKQTPEDKYYHDEEVANGDVYKFFFNDDPGVHNVTFDVEDGVLDGYEVKKDVIADVADFSEAVKAVGPTKFTIAPVSRTAAEGFTVKVGEEEIAAVDGVYTFETTADTKVEIKAAAPKTFEVVFNITGAEGLVATYASTGEKIEFEEGENTIDVPENDTEIIFALADKEQYKWVTFTDGEYDGLDYMENNVIDWNIDKGVEYTIVIEKIQRDNKLVIFYDEFTNPDSAFGPKFSKYTIPNEIKPGYNVVEFADEDGSLSVNLIDAGTVYPYKNDEKTGLKPLTSLYEDADVADGNVYKFFFNTDPGVHNVTFNVEDGILDGYEVKKDIIADVDATTPVKAVGPTRFTIAPVSRAAEGFFVKVGGKAIEPVDGVYTFTTTADTTVDITSKTSGIDEILMNANGPVDVFNLQGIRVLHDADADDIKALTPGFYIINGTKVLVK